MPENILEVKNLKTWFFTRRGIVKAVNGVNFTLSDGECLCLVGESGCGKSVTALSILRLFDSPPGKIVAGEINYCGANLVVSPVAGLRRIRGKDIAMIFQNAQSALNPVFTIGDQIVEQIETHLDIGRKAATAKASALLDEMNIPDPVKALKMFPHQMSGGMKQRAMIAMGLSCDPKVLIADEPTTAVDVTIRAQIMNILAELKMKRHMSTVFITHDLSLVSEIGDKVAVIYAGKVAEVASVANILHHPAHPYTIGLIECLPDISSNLKRLPSIPGNTPNPINIPSGCAFHPRCPKVMSVCREVEPELLNISDVRTVACHLYD